MIKSGKGKVALTMGLAILLILGFGAGIAGVFLNMYYKDVRAD